jgi:methionyl-tRNA synthetase
MGEYENLHRVVYGEGATFVPVCEKCGRFVKPDETVKIGDFVGLSKDTNAECSKCGRTHMIFEGFL